MKFRLFALVAVSFSLMLVSKQAQANNCVKTFNENLPANLFMLEGSVSTPTFKGSIFANISASHVNTCLETLGMGFLVADRVHVPGSRRLSRSYLFGFFNSPAPLQQGHNYKIWRAENRTIELEQYIISRLVGRRGMVKRTVQAPIRTHVICYDFDRPCDHYVSVRIPEYRTEKGVLIRPAAQYGLRIR